MRTYLKKLFAATALLTVAPAFAQTTAQQTG